MRILFAIPASNLGHKERLFPLTGSEIFLYVLLAIVFGFGIRRLKWALQIPHYSPQEIAEKLSSGEPPVLLDVRTNSERRSGGIRSSVHIPLHELSRRLGELSPYKDKEMVVYCHRGNRSLVAAARLRKSGFQAANMKGGIAEWNFQNLS